MISLDVIDDLEGTFFVLLQENKVFNRFTHEIFPEETNDQSLQDQIKWWYDGR
tara:strand:+ start:949 stop:1107 length:159 start_codon:yes stop_codon:yes gene_type:complete